MAQDTAPRRSSFATAGIIAALAVNCALLALVMYSLERSRRPSAHPPTTRVLPRSIPPTVPAAQSPSASDAPRAGSASGTPEAPAGSGVKPEREQSVAAITGTIGRSEAPATSAAPPRGALPARTPAGGTSVETANPAVVPTPPVVLPLPMRAGTGAPATIPSAPGLPDLSSAAPLPGIAPPAYTPVAAPSPAALGGGGRMFSDESSVLAGLLRQYESAYQRRDAAGAATLWPTVDLRALTRAFARLRMQNLEFGDCTFAVAQTEATARCAGVLRYAQRIGDPSIQTEHHVWTVEFVRRGESWKIARITAQ
jgi:hypothetical protein